MFNYQHGPFHPRPIKSWGGLRIAGLTIRRRWMSFPSCFQIQEIYPALNYRQITEGGICRLDRGHWSLGWHIRLSNRLLPASRPSTWEQLQKEPSLICEKFNVCVCLCVCLNCLLQMVPAFSLVMEVLHVPELLSKGGAEFCGSA